MNYYKHDIYSVEFCDKLYLCSNSKHMYNNLNKNK